MVIPFVCRSMRNPPIGVLTMVILSWDVGDRRTTEPRVHDARCLWCRYIVVRTRRAKLRLFRVKVGRRFPPLTPVPEPRFSEG